MLKLKQSQILNVQKTIGKTNFFLIMNDAFDVPKLEYLQGT